MKTATAKLQETLYLNNNWLVADLFTFSFREGPLFLTSADVNVVSGSTTFITGTVITRGALRTAIGSEVGNLDITIDPGDMAVGGTPMRLHAVRGGFDSIPVKVERAYTTGSYGQVSATGTVIIFSGSVVNTKPGSTNIMLTVASVTSMMNSKMPWRLYQQLCPYNVFDSNCGLNAALYTSSSVTSTGSTTTVVIPQSITQDAFKLGMITFTAGALSGTVRTVMSDVDVTGTHTFQVFPPLPAPATGSVSFRPGCNKYLWTFPVQKPVDCLTYNNKARFGGFNSLPSIAALKNW